MAELGLPVHLLLTPGQASDKTTFPELIEGVSLAPDVVADRGYFAGSIIALIEAAGATAHIPSQSNVRVRRTVDRQIYRQRDLVERFFNKLKHFRRIAARGACPRAGEARPGGQARQKLPRRRSPRLSPPLDQAL